MKQRLHEDDSASGQTALPRFEPVVGAAMDEPDSIVHALVEDYLDRVCRPLIETHSYSVRYDLRQEVGQHIRSLIRAYQEMGDASIVAAEKALVKFGEADTVARQWKLPASTIRRKPMGWWFRQQWQGIAATLAMCSVALAVCGGITFRAIGTQQAAVREQVRAAESQSTGLAANSGFHKVWAAQHQCTECHRGYFSQPAASQPAFTSRFLDPQSRQ
jgi:hypothetical protein